jgi:estrogen-related receptor beta like 1
MTRSKTMAPRLTVHDKENQEGWRQRLELNNEHLQSVNAEFVVLEKQMTHIGKSVKGDLTEIKTKENQLNEIFREKVEAYQQTKSKLKELKKAHDTLTASTKQLAEDLNDVTHRNNDAKKKIAEKSSSMTNAAPLVEIRSALQRLKTENKELAVLIGVLDYEFTKALANEANPQERSPPRRADSDDEESVKRVD